MVRCTPQLTGPLALAIANRPYVHASLAFVRARSAYWEEDGLPPQMWTDSPIEEIYKYFDDSTGDDRPLLTVRLNGSACARLDAMAEPERGRFIVAVLERLRPAASGQLQYLGYQGWAAMPYQLGAYHHLAPGQFRQFGRKFFPADGRLFFAGEHLATRQVGLEAAMESSHREVRALLTSRSG